MNLGIPVCIVLIRTVYFSVDVKTFKIKSLREVLILVNKQFASLYFKYPHFYLNITCFGKALIYLETVRKY